MGFMAFPQFSAYTAKPGRNPILVMVCLVDIDAGIGLVHLLNAFNLGVSSGSRVPVLPVIRSGIRLLFG